MILNKEIINEIKRDVDIIDIIGDYIKLSKKGNNFIGLCPFHEDTEPSLIVSNTKKIYKCFACDEGGDVISFVKKIEKTNFNDAIKIIAKKANINNVFIDDLSNNIDDKKNTFFNINKQASFIFKRFLYNPENKMALNYLYSRGLDDKTIDLFNIGFAPNEYNSIFKIMTNHDNILWKKDSNEIWNPIDLIESGLIILDSKNNYQDFFKNRIIFPIADKYGNIMGFSGRTIDNDESIKYLNSKTNEFFQKDSLFFNMNNVLNSDNKRIFLTEGFFDVISCFQKGHKNFLGLMGTSFSSNHKNILNKNNCKKIILCMDNDKAGQKANIKIGLELMQINKIIMVVNDYNSKYKDIDSLISAEPNLFENVINSYISYTEYYINKSFASINDNLLDEKLETLNKMEDFIACNIEYNLISYYSEILSNITKLNCDDIKKNIIHKKDLFLNKLSFNENIIYQNQLYIRNKYEINQNNIIKNRILNIEKTLLILMIIEPELTYSFKKDLNYINIEKDDKNYYLLKMILLISYEKNNNYTYSDILTNMDEKILDTSFKEYIKKEVLIRMDEIKIKNNYSIDDILNQGKDLIKELINNKDKNQ